MVTRSALVFACLQRPPARTAATSEEREIVAAFDAEWECAESDIEKADATAAAWARRQVAMLVGAPAQGRPRPVQ